MRSMLRSQYEVAFWANAAAGARSASRAARSGVGLMVFMGFSSGLEAEADLELDFALVVAAGIGADDVEAVDGAAQPGGSEPVGGIHGRAGAVRSGGSRRSSSRPASRCRPSSSPPATGRSGASAG